MPVKVGIPRALMYYYYFPLWKGFFEGLGAQVIVSPKTTKAVLDKGVKSAVDEACLPVKLFYGHVIELKDRVDYIFVPRIVSVEKKAYICPKFLGLPDMIRHNIDGLPRLIDVTVNLNRRQRNLISAVYEVGREFTANPLAIWRAFMTGLARQRKFDRLTASGLLPHEALEEMEKGGEMKGRQDTDCGLQIALVGHGYNIYDSYISMNIIQKLRDMGVKVLTADNIDAADIEQGAARLPKRLFWTLGRKMVGSAFHYSKRSDVDGLIHLAAFGCGPDSFTGEIIERTVRREKEIPFMNLTIDEHTGEAGVVTRLEAFVDMIRWRAAQ
jgi:predicted nucleotide-binding protein (sugar kinase/HSP70/actin superfamily)